jgi:hypothetical protein
MTIEARRITPAGWYTDPMHSGAKRWWDGVQWTEHVRAYAAPAKPKSVKPAPNPYGLQGVVVEPRVPMTDEELEAAGKALHSASGAAANNAAWLSLLFGLLAVGLSLLTALPVSQTIWVVGAGLVAFFWGVRALLRRHNGDASNAWAPALGILLGISAALAMLLGVNVAGFVSSLTTPTVTSSPATSAIASAPTASTVPLVFANNSGLTADETAAQTLATAINRSFAHGSATLAAGETWPSGLRMNGSSVIAANGARLANLPAGLVASYQLAANGTSYHLAVHGQNELELATYNSGANTFSWTCIATDTTCTPSN